MESLPQKLISTVFNANVGPRKIFARRKALAKKQKENILVYEQSVKSRLEFLEELKAVLDGSKQQIGTLQLKWQSELSDAKATRDKELLSVARALNHCLVLLSEIKKHREEDLRQTEQLRHQLDAFVDSTTQEIQKIRVSGPAGGVTDAPVAQSRGGLLKNSMFEIIPYNVGELIQGGRGTKKRKTKS